jgi:hypothetical protein
MTIQRNNKGYPLLADGTIDWALTSIEKSEYESSIANYESKRTKLDGRFTLAKKRRKRR